MSTLFSVLALALQLYLYLLIARLIVEWIQVFAREWRPKGVVLVVVEGIFSLTDPPLRALRKVIPPLRLGGVMLDLAFVVLFLLISLALNLLAMAAYRLPV